MPGNGRHLAAIEVVEYEMTAEERIALQFRDALSELILFQRERRYSKHPPKLAIQWTASYLAEMFEGTDDLALLVELTEATKKASENDTGDD